SWRRGSNSISARWQFGCAKFSAAVGAGRPAVVARYTLHKDRRVCKGLAVAFEDLSRDRAKVGRLRCFIICLLRACCTNEKKEKPQRHKEQKNSLCSLCLCG